MTRKSGGALFVRLDMAHLAAIRTLSLRSLLLLARGGGGGGWRARGSSCAGFGRGCGGDAFGFFAGEPTFTIAFQTSQLRRDPKGETELANWFETNDKGTARDCKAGRGDRSKEFSRAFRGLKQ